VNCIYISLNNFPIIAICLQNSLTLCPHILYTYKKVVKKLVEIIVAQCPDRARHALVAVSVNSAVASCANSILFVRCRHFYDNLFREPLKTVLAFC
jgi:hypothetical protein